MYVKSGGGGLLHVGCTLHFLEETLRSSAININGIHNDVQKYLKTYVHLGLAEI